MTLHSVAEFNEIVLHDQGNNFGFEVIQYQTCEFYEIKADYLNFIVHSDWTGSDWKKGIERRAVKITASISRMGGQPTVEELLRASDEIRRGAELVKKINDMEIVIESNH